MIISRVECREKIGVCLDTCHVSDGGYDIAGNLEEVLGEFDRVIGLDRLKALHINDSLNPPGARRTGTPESEKERWGLRPYAT